MFEKGTNVQITKQGRRLGQVGSVTKDTLDETRVPVSFGGRGRPSFFTNLDFAIVATENVAIEAPQVMDMDRNVEEIVVETPVARPENQEAPANNLDW